ncbi:MAG: DEAD/DEAH box helicase [Candidatus Omnitrophota bacterium]
MKNRPPITFDAFQQKAIDCIKEGHSVIVSAPTGAGKTVIAEYVIEDCLAKNRSAVYTAPIKALSNQKYRDFQGSYGDKIGILTGDVSINPDAPILIMTTEIFRNKILESDKSLAAYSWIIFDEIHYLDDYERGTVWEESLIFLPKHMNMLALSATIPNMREFAAWLESIHQKPMRVITEEKRPVPLHFYYQCHGMILDNINKVRHGFAREMFYYHQGRRFLKKGLKPNRTDSLIRHLKENLRLPAIYFVFSRRRCEYLAGEIAGFDFLSDDEKDRISALYLDLCRKFGLTDEKSALNLQPLIERGIAYHHAGMLPTLKEVVERLFTSRLIKIIFTTETFALGINMPARTVVFDELRKFYGRFHRAMRTRDFYQMAGRAGRRGIDEEGFVYNRVNPNYITFPELKTIIYGRYENVRSRFNLSYATVLNLYERFNEKIYDIYPLSFHFFRETKKSRDRVLAALHAKVALMKELGYIRDGRLTEKGVFASNIHGYELPLSELYEKGLFNGLSAEELGILCIAMVFEPRKGAERPRLDRKTRALQDMTEHLMYHVHYVEKKHGITDLSKNFFFHLSACLESWMRGDAFDKMLRYTDADEGEIIRYFRMCIQILREILDTRTPQGLKEKIKKTLSLINRDIVDAEKQLRIEVDTAWSPPA